MTTTTPTPTHYGLPVRRIRRGDLIIQGQQAKVVEQVNVHYSGREMILRTTRDGFTGSMSYSFGVTFDVFRAAS